MGANEKQRTKSGWRNVSDFEAPHQADTVTELFLLNPKRWVSGWAMLFSLIADGCGRAMWNRFRLLEIMDSDRLRSKVHVHRSHIVNELERKLKIQSVY